MLKIKFLSLLFLLLAVRLSAQSFEWEISIQDSSRYNLYFFEGKECFFLDAKVLTLPKDSTIERMESKINWEKIPQEWYKPENYECKYISASGKKLTYRNRGYVFENQYEMIIKRVGTEKTETMTIKFPITQYCNKPTRFKINNLTFKVGTFDISKNLQYQYESDGSLTISLPENYFK
ncbi:MAG: hypothetical protein ACKVTZ_14650 [Bacteroidia bacterium]